MSGLKKKVYEIADPANFFGKREGGVNWSNAIDPGGSIIKTTTGSNIGRKVADPGKLYSTGKVDSDTIIPLTTAEKREKRMQSESILAEAQRRLRMAARQSILTEDID